MPLWCSTLSYLKFFNRQKQTIIINKKMKKLTVVAMLAIAAATFTACGNSSPKAEMKNDIDSLSYAIGLEQSQGVRQYLEQMNIDTAYIDEFVKGLNAGALSQDDKRKAAYNAGVAIGMQTAMMTKGINRQLFGEDSTKTISLRNFLAGFAAGATGKNQKMDLMQARTIEQIKAQAIQSQAAEKKYGKNKKVNEQFMAANAKKPGVQKLANGVQYKVVKAGKGVVPTKNDMVSVNYTGRTIDGKVFDTTQGKQPAQMPVGQVIPGFTEALTHMPVGSTWEVYIPASQAYGANSPSADIKPFSALIFTVELLSVEKNPSAGAQPAAHVGANKGK